MHFSQLHYLTRPKVNISLLVLHVTHTVGSLAVFFYLFILPFVIVLHGVEGQAIMVGLSVEMWKLPENTFAANDRVTSEIGGIKYCARLFGEIYFRRGHAI